MLNATMSNAQRKNPKTKAAFISSALALAFAAWGTGAGRAAAAPAMLPSTHSPAAISQILRIVAFGSSSTQGVGATNPSATYPAQLQTILAHMLPHGRSVQVLNRGIGGEDADDMMKRLQNDVIARHPDVVIWQTGSNDPMRHVPLDRFQRETHDGVVAMEKAGIEVILMEPQWCPRLERTGTAESYRDVIRRLGADLHVDVVRRDDLMHDWLRQGLLTRTQMLAADGLHMTDGGYALLARSVAPEVLKVEDLKPIQQASDTKLAITPSRTN